MSEALPQPARAKRRRRWFQFTVRSLLVLTLLGQLPALRQARLERTPITDAALPALVRLKRKGVWLELSGTNLSDKALAELGRVGKETSGPRALISSTLAK